jgi:hypothetical protein
MVRGVVQVMHLYKVEICFSDKMLCNVWLNLGFFFIKGIMWCSHRGIVQSGVSLLFLWFFQSKLLFQGFWEHECRFTGVEYIEIILLTMIHLNRILHVLNRGCSMVTVVCYSVKRHSVVDALFISSEGNSLACQSVTKSSQEKLEQTCTQVLSSPYHFIVSPAYIASWIEWSKNLETSLPRAGRICQFWSIVWTRILPSERNPSAYWDRGYNQYQIW